MPSSQLCEALLQLNKALRGGGIIRSGSAQNLYDLGTSAIHPASLDCPVIGQFYLKSKTFSHLLNSLILYA